MGSDYVTREDHPRSRGVYSRYGLGLRDARGSSPLARGLRSAAAPTLRAGWIIPARAGFTNRDRVTFGHTRDHPRSRGVYKRSSGRRGGRGGSSPLARGLPGERAHHSKARGIIPARAGFTTPAPPRPTSPGDHPRSRGVYRGVALSMRYRRGSSPLARGLLIALASPYGSIGIIPARAGFTRSPPVSYPHAEDHPRSRGVYGGDGQDPCRQAGSSPLARGLQACVARVKACIGIIPARAGFTRTRSHRIRGSWDHPRSRGVYGWWLALRITLWGSSPLARGLHVVQMEKNKLPGIIPARAGFTRHAQVGQLRAQDHPRSRGVYPQIMGKHSLDKGSSPLARGLPP